MRSAVVFACHEAACRPPKSGGTGGSSPKAVGVPYKTPNGWAIKAADGTTLQAVFSKVNPPYDPDPNSSIDNIWDGVAQDALHGLKAAYDLAPTRKVPKVVIGDFTTNEQFVRDYQRTIDAYAKKGIVPRDPETREPVSARAMARRTTGLVYNRTVEGAPVGKGMIGINASDYYYANIMGDRRSSTAMSESHLVSESEYTVMHEYGHHRYHNGSDGIGRFRADSQYMMWKDSPELSSYGKSSVLEAHAEVFAAWAVRESNGLEQTEITKSYQDEFGWGEPDAMDFASDIIEVEGIEHMLDAPDFGAVIVYDDGKLVFSPVNSDS